MLHPDHVVKMINPIVGKGVIATQDIPAGTITWVPNENDTILSEVALSQLLEEERELFLLYSYRTSEGSYYHCQDDTHFMNHSSHANCFRTPFGFEIAVKDIILGEELTNDYGQFNIIAPFIPEEEVGGRDVIYPDDLLRFSREWDEKVLQAVQKSIDVEQPLEKYMTEKMSNLCEKVISTGVLPYSIETLFFRDFDNDSAESYSY